MTQANEEIRRSILCVEDETDAREIIDETLREHRVVFARTAFEALRAVNNDVFDAYLLDFWLPGWSGVQLCRQVRKMDPHGPVVFCSAATREREQQQAMRAGATAYICKPADPQVLRSRLEVLLTLALRESRAAEAPAQDALEKTLAQFAQKLTQVGRVAPGAEFIERAARPRIYAVYIEHRGTRANFERWWPHAFARTLTSRGEFRDRQAVEPLDPQRAR